MQNFSDDNYMVAVPMDFFGNKPCEIHVRYVNANNSYLFRIDSDLKLIKRVKGQETTLGTAAVSVDVATYRIKLSGTSIKIWQDAESTPRIDVTDSTFSAGGVAMSGNQPWYDSLKIGYDNNGDNEWTLDSAGGRSPRVAARRGRMRPPLCQGRATRATIW